MYPKPPCQKKRLRSLRIGKILIAIFFLSIASCPLSGPRFSYSTENKKAACRAAEWTSFAYMEDHICLNPFFPFKNAEIHKSGDFLSIMCWPNLPQYLADPIPNAPTLLTLSITKGAQCRTPRSRMQDQGPNTEHQFANFLGVVLILRSIFWPLKRKLMAFSCLIQLSSVPPGV